jgi:hypothetical protein
VGPLQDRKDAEEKEKRGQCKGGEDSPFKAEGLPENRGVAEGAKPEQIDPVRECGAAAENDQGNGGQNKENSAPARARGLYWAWPINGFGQFFTPLYVQPGFGRSGNRTA